TVAEPTVNLTFEYGSSRRASTGGPGVWVTGPVSEKRFEVGIFVLGGVLGVNFHRGATLAYADVSPSRIRYAPGAAADWFPTLEADLGLTGAFSPASTVESCLHETGGARAGKPQAGRTAGGLDLAGLAASVEGWLLSRRPQMSPGYTRLQHVLN